MENIMIIDEEDYIDNDEYENYLEYLNEEDDRRYDIWNWKIEYRIWGFTILGGNMVGTSNKIITYLLKQAKDKQFEIKEYRPKRSLDSNAYCWVLCDKIAKELSKDENIITKEKIYQDGILQIGSFEPLIIEEKAFEKFKRMWKNQGLGFLVQEVSRKDKCVKVHCYYGSSTYDSKEMSLLINLLVELAKSLNIETKSQAEIDSLLESWGKNEQKK